MGLRLAGLSAVAVRFLAEPWDKKASVALTRVAPAQKPPNGLDRISGHRRVFAELDWAVTVRLVSSLSGSIDHLPKKAPLLDVKLTAAFCVDPTSLARQAATVNNPDEAPTKRPATTSLRKWIFIAKSAIANRRARNFENRIHNTDITAAITAAWPEGKDSNDLPEWKRWNP